MQQWYDSKGDTGTVGFLYTASDCVLRGDREKPGSHTVSPAAARSQDRGTEGTFLRAS